MRIAVIAGNGRSGRAFVEAALGAGHTVRVGVHTEALFSDLPNLVVLPCDATSLDDLEILVSGQDAVVSFIGHVKGSLDDLQTRAVSNTIEAMHRAGNKRFVSLTGTGVRFPGDTVTFIDRVLNLAIKLIDPKRIADGKNHVNELLKCDLEWTVLRVLKLTNGPAKPFSLTEHGPTKTTTSRKEVAQAMLQIVEQKSFVHQAPIISKP